MNNQVINGRFTGLKDIYLAEVTENTSGGYTAGTPFLLARAIEAKTDVKVASEAVYSSNSIEYVESSFEEGSLTLSVNDLSPYAKSIMFGHKYDQETGLLNLNTGDVSNPVAIGFRATRSNGCKQQLRWYYTVVFSPLSETFETSGEKTKAQQLQIKGTFTGRALDGEYGVVLDEEYIPSGTNVTALLTQWFSEVVPPTGLKL